jgi:hypothetical protein
MRPHMGASVAAILVLMSARGEHVRPGSHPPRAAYSRPVAGASAPELSLSDVQPIDDPGDAFRVARETDSAFARGGRADHTGESDD